MTTSPPTLPELLDKGRRLRRELDRALVAERDVHRLKPPAPRLSDEATPPGSGPRVRWWVIGQAKRLCEGRPSLKDRQALVNQWRQQQLEARGTERPSFVIRHELKLLERELTQTC